MAGQVQQDGELSPIHYAIATIDETIANLQVQRRALQAQLPDTSPCKLVPILDPRGARKKKAGRRG